MAVDSDKIAAFVAALKNKFEQKANKVTSWSSSTSNDKYPSEKLVKDSLDAKQDSNKKVTSWTTTVSNDNYPSEKLVKDSLDAKQDASTAFDGDYTKLTNVPSTFTPSTHSHGSITNDGKLGSTANKPLITGANGVISAGSFGTTANTFAEGNHTHSDYLTEHQSLSDIGGAVTVVQKQTANTGAFKSYQIFQGGSAVSGEIDIPKDFLVKSGSVKTAGETPTSAETSAGVGAGEKYLSLIINTKDNETSTGNNELIIPAKDLVEDTTYTVDNSTLEMSNANQIKVKANGITTTQLASGIVTSLGYADNWNISAAKTITSSDINAWNAKSELTTSDIEDAIESVLTSLTNEINK